MLCISIFQPVMPHSFSVHLLIILYKLKVLMVIPFFLCFVGKLSAEDIQKFDYSLPVEGTIDERVLKCKQANETASSSQNAAASAIHNKAVKEKKKKDVSRVKKLKKNYFCLMPF